ncbi:MAG: hypothetical protein ACREMO_08570, partial [Gemmatimonadales bacterium]
QAVVVRALLTLDHRSRPDAERHFRQYGRFENTLLPHERHSPPVELKARRQDLPREYIPSVEIRLLLQELKGPRADPAIEICFSHLT